MSDWQGVVDSCLEVLETDSANTKALYHRVQGWPGFKEYDQALTDFIFFLISWRLITLQYCSGFCHT